MSAASTLGGGLCLAGETSASLVWFGLLAGSAAGFGLDRAGDTSASLVAGFTGPLVDRTGAAGFDVTGWRGFLAWRGFLGWRGFLAAAAGFLSLFFASSRAFFSFSRAFFPCGNLSSATRTRTITLFSSPGANAFP